MEQIWSIIVSFWQTYRDQILVGLIVGLPALIATIWGIIYQRRQWLAERRRDEEERARLEAEAKARAAFPFRRTTPDELPQHLVNFTYKDIPHVPRCAPQRQAELEALVQEKRVLLTGRSGLGKTHEAIHLVRRLAGERPPGRVIVLVPEGRLAEPRELPPDLPTRQNTVVLFLDNLHEEFREAYERPRGEARAGGPDPRTTLQAVLRWFEARCDDFRVVATVREEPGPPGHRGWREWLGYREDGTLWGKFRRYPLPEMEREQALGFIQAMQEWLAAVRGLPLDVDPDAAELMARKFDGTPASLRDFLLIQRETKGRERVTRAIVAQEFDGRFPHDWEREVYNAHIAPYSAPRHLFVALSLLQQAGVTPYWFLAFRLATRMWGIHPSEEERLLGHALMRVETWVKVRDGVLECSEAYLEGRADLAEGARELATVLLAASRKYLPLLAPELIRLGNALWALPRGDRAQNLEEAIACYQRALEVYTRADFPADWAMTQNNLGNAYSDRIRGDRAENLEEAIACYQRALEVYTRADFPVEWATTQNNLGLALADRIRGDRAENLEEAIACYQRALEVRTRADFPVEWARTQNNLGLALADRIRGDRAENLEEAIGCYQRALEVLGRPDMLPEWAEIVRNNLQRAQQELAALAGGAGASE